MPFLRAFSSKEERRDMVMGVRGSLAGLGNDCVDPLAGESLLGARYCQLFLTFSALCNEGKVSLCASACQPRETSEIDAIKPFPNGRNHPRLKQIHLSTKFLYVLASGEPRTFLSMLNFTDTLAPRSDTNPRGSSSRNLPIMVLSRANGRSPS